MQKDEAPAWRGSVEDPDMGLAKLAPQLPQLPRDLTRVRERESNPLLLEQSNEVEQLDVGGKGQSLQEVLDRASPCNSAVKADFAHPRRLPEV